MTSLEDAVSDIQQLTVHQAAQLIRTWHALVAKPVELSDNLVHQLFAMFANRVQSCVMQQQQQLGDERVQVVAHTALRIADALVHRIEIASALFHSLDRPRMQQVRPWAEEAEMQNRFWQLQAQDASILTAWATALLRATHVSRVLLSPTLFNVAHDSVDVVVVVVGRASISHRPRSSVTTFTWLCAACKFLYRHLQQLSLTSYRRYNLLQLC